MSKREIYEQKTEEILNPIMEELEFELVDVEYVKEGSMWYLRKISKRLVQIIGCNVIAPVKKCEVFYPEIIHSFFHNLRQTVVVPCDHFCRSDIKYY